MLFPQSQLIVRNLADLRGQVLLVEPMADTLMSQLKNQGLTVSCYCTDAAVAKAHSRADALYFSPYLECSQQFDTVVLFYPKSKEQLSSLLAEVAPHCHANTDIYLVGDNKGGIKSLPTQAEKLGLHAHKLDNAKHCLWFALTGVQNKAWTRVSPALFPVSGLDIPLQISSMPGVFNHGKLDQGTALLLQQVGFITAMSKPAKVLDFACGTGVIGLYLKSKNPKLALTVTDICALSCHCAEQTFANAGLTADVRCLDGLAELSGSFDAIVSNPPFHTGLKTDLSIAEQFIQQAVRLLVSGGSLTLVANSHLPYQQWLEQQFGNVRELARANGFVIWQSQKR